MRLTEEQVKEALNESVAMIRRNLETYTYHFQDAASTNGIYKPIENTYWTTGFWTGEIWLAYEYTNDPVFKYAAMIQVESFLDRIVKKIEVDHHDMGFLYSLSCVAAYKLTGDERAKRAAILAADQLITRFRVPGNFLQAWGSLDDPKNYRLIIDCLLNLPLLYWASEVTGDVKYEEIALKHIKTALDNVIRDDNSTHHTFYFDPTTGAPLYGETCQGYDNTSAWARGQAWGIYGAALSYRYTKNEEYIETFRKVSTFFLEHCPSDQVPYWDLVFSDGSREPKDSSSAAIAVCGFLEMAKYLDEDESVKYIDMAHTMMNSLIQNYTVKDPNQANGLLLHGTYSKKSPFNTCTEYGVDECTSWGDYFYMEALTRMYKDWNLYW